LHGEGEENGSQWFFKSPPHFVERGFRGGDRMKTLSETQVNFEGEVVLSIMAHREWRSSNKILKKNYVYENR